MARVKDNQPLLDGEASSAKPIKQNAGFKYEEDLIKFLRSKGFTCGDPAGADNAKADLEITFPKNAPKITKFELKEKLSADFAQLNFDFDTNQMKFFVDERKNSNQKEAAQTMIGIAKNFNIIREANNHWKPKSNPPQRFVMGEQNYSNLAKRKIARKLDLQNFPDKYLLEGTAAAEQVEKYYNSKNTYYIQVKGYGLYYMGRDIENFGVPRFSRSVGISNIRIRIKTNSASQERWSFLMALKIGRLRKSPFDLDKDPSFMLK
tara:strand:+ start:58 stop:846 length:789 start_codon:yes stop_codon:yes gene_type:complete